MAQAMIQPTAEYLVKCTDKLCISAKKNEKGECTVVIHKDKIKLSLSIEEFNILGREKDCIDLACCLLTGRLGFEKPNYGHLQQMG